MKQRLLAAALAALAAPSYAAFSAGISQTTGNDNYESTKIDASADLGSTLTVSPSYNRYRTQFTNGTYQDFALRADFAQGPADLGVKGSVLPRVNGYEQGSVGADLTISLVPGTSPHGHKLAGPNSGGASSSGYGLGKADVGVSANEILHNDQLTASGAPRASSLNVAETDLSAFAGLQFMMTDISAQVTKSYYDKDMSKQSLRPAPYLSLVGVDAIEFGYPDLSYNLQLLWKVVPLVGPFLSYTHTTFELGESPSNAFEVGLKVGLEMLSVRGAYEHYEQNGIKDHNYLTLGASLNFGN